MRRGSEPEKLLIVRGIVIDYPRGRRLKKTAKVPTQLGPIRLLEWRLVLIGLFVGSSPNPNPSPDTGSRYPSTPLLGSRQNHQSILKRTRD